MGNESRVRKSLRNAIVGMSGLIVSLVVSFLAMSVFVRLLGAEYNGVKGLPINDSKVWVHSIVQLTKMNRHDIILYDRAMAFDITNVVLRLREYYFSRMGAQK